MKSVWFLSAKGMYIASVILLLGAPVARAGTDSHVSALVSGIAKIATMAVAAGASALVAGFIMRRMLLSESGPKKPIKQQKGKIYTLKDFVGEPPKELQKLVTDQIL